MAKVWEGELATCLRRYQHRRARHRESAGIVTGGQRRHPGRRCPFREVLTKLTKGVFWQFWQYADGALTEGVD
jgi:hypothetical protein